MKYYGCGQPNIKIMGVLILLEIKDMTALGRGGEELVRSLSLGFEGKGIFGVLCSSAEAREAIAAAICGARDADGGKVLIDGEEMHRENLALKRRVRLVPNADVDYGAFTLFEHMETVGSALRLDNNKKYRQIGEAIDLMGLEEVKNTPIAALTASQKCRLGIAAALLGNPELIVIDSALDALSQKPMSAIAELLKMLGGIKGIVLLTSRPEYARAICDRVAIIAGGELALCDGVADIEAKINETALTYAYVRGDAERIVAAISAMDEVISARLDEVKSDGVNKIAVEHKYDKLIKDKLFSALAGINAPMLSTKTAALSLEDVYYSFISREGRDADKEVR